MNLEEIEKDVAIWKSHKSWCRSYYPNEIGDFLIQRVKELQKGFDHYRTQYDNQTYRSMELAERVNELEADLALNASILAKQCDLAREAETRVKELEAENEDTDEVMFKALAKVGQLKADLDHEKDRSLGAESELMTLVEDVRKEKVKVKELEKGIRKHQLSIWGNTPAPHGYDEELYKLIEK